LSLALIRSGTKRTFARRSASGRDGSLDGASAESGARDNCEMRKHRNLAVVQRRYFRAFESHPARDHKSMKCSAPDEAQNRYSMAMKPVSNFVHRHEISVGLRS